MDQKNYLEIMGNKPEKQDNLNDLKLSKQLKEGFHKLKQSVKQLIKPKEQEIKQQQQQPQLQKKESQALQQQQEQQWEFINDLPIKIDLLNIDQQIIARISVFLNLKDIRILRCSNIRLYSMISQSGLSSNYMSKYLDLGMNEIIFNASIKNSLEISKSLISINTTSDWLKFYAQQQEMDLQWTIMKLPIPKLTITLSHPILIPELANQYALSSFQQQALLLRENFKSHQNNLSTQDTEKYQNLRKYLLSIDIKAILKVKQLVFDDQNCPLSLKKTYLEYIYMINQCYFYRQVLEEATNIQDKLSLLNLYSLCWRQFSEQIIQSEMGQNLNLLKLTSTQDQECFTLTDLIIQLWSKIVLDSQISLSAYLISSFQELLLEFRKQKLLENIDATLANQKFKSGDIIKTLSNYFKALCDVSCHSDTVSWIGHTNFKGIDQFKEGVYCAKQQTSEAHIYCQENFPQNFDLIFKVLECDLEIIRGIFGQWVADIHIEPMNLNFLREHLKNFMKQENIQIDMQKYKQDDENEQKSQILVQSVVVRRSDLLEQLINEGIKEIKQDENQEQLTSSYRRSSDISTQPSSIYGSNLFGSMIQQDDNDLTLKISKYFQTNYSSISKKVLDVEYQQALLDHNLDTRNLHIERSQDWYKIKSHYDIKQVQFKSIPMQYNMTQSQIIQSQFSDGIQETQVKNYLDLT